MVIWVFAGGGETELKGLILFLTKNFTFHAFERKTPIRKKPGPRPSLYHALGYTGQSLRDQIGFALEQALRDGICDRILVLDDLDCHNLEERSRLFDEAIRQVPGTETIRRMIAFAVPEIEAWLISDWNQSFAIDLDLRRYHVVIRRELSRIYQESSINGDINLPESFSVLNEERGACDRKLSEEISQTVRIVTGINYSKDEHSGSMLQRVRAEVIQSVCPIFRRALYDPLRTRIENQ